jgi:light-regulated signal transduction histidine kinase (bacteriophytochrome)
MEELDLAAIARAVIHDLQAEYQERSPEIIVHELPEAKGDPVLIRQVFANLLSNAFKFTRDKPNPKIEAGGYKSMESMEENIYFISDNGVGFDMKYADRLFGLFQRLHGEAQYEGTGIGLATVQRIIRRHGGRVWAEGKVNEGASFFFTLPGIHEA